MIKKWIKKFNEKLHKANEDDRGSAFVMVVIGVMATAIIGATVLSDVYKRQVRRKQRSRNRKLRTIPRKRRKKRNLNLTLI